MHIILIYLRAINILSPIIGVDDRNECKINEVIR